MHRARDELVVRANAAVVVVTAASPAARAGCLVGFHAQSSIEPWQYTVFLSRDNATYRVAREAEHLIVHFLGAHQRELAAHFGEQTADGGPDKFADVAWVTGPDERTPRLADVSDWLCGRIHAVHDLDGDHVAFVLGRVAAHTGGGALLRYADVRDLEAGHPA